jgi:hypothetical protein
MRHHRRLAALLLASLPALLPQPASSSSLDRALVLRIIQQRKAEIHKCYTDALSWNPELKGRLLIRFTVESDGTVSRAEEQAPPGEKFPDEVMARCVTDEFLLLQFPPGPGAIHITYPMIFSQKPNKPR